MNSNYREIIDHLKAADTVGVFVHVNPDGDCIGSALAVYGFLTALGKTVHCFSPHKPAVPEKLQFLPMSQVVNNFEPLKKYDVCLGVDLGDAGRIGDELYRFFLRGKIKIVIDHHVEHEDFANITLRETETASTTQILYKIFNIWDQSIINADIAALLYAGLVTDTGGFSFCNTSSDTHRMAAAMIDYGIDNAELNRRLMKDIEPNVFMLRNRVLSRTEFYDEGLVALIAFRLSDFEETGTTENDTEGAINSILNVKTVEVAISIAETASKKYKISFRTKRTVNAGACAKAFGGGGHFHAAGCRANGHFEDVHRKVLEVVREMLSYAR